MCSLCGVLHSKIVSKHVCRKAIAPETGAHALPAKEAPEEEEVEEEEEEEFGDGAGPSKAVAKAVATQKTVEDAGVAAEAPGVAAEDEGVVAAVAEDVAVRPDARTYWERRAREAGIDLSVMQCDDADVVE
jgi:hypothetical protein